jgi:hypothetical protein
MKKIFLSIGLILPLILMSCTNKVVDNNKPKEETNIIENNEIKEDDTIKKEEEPKENVENEPANPGNVEVISPIEPLVDSRFGYLELIYSEDGDYYLNLDEAEIFFGEEAVNEAVYDGKAEYEDGRAFVFNSYYIRNNYNTLSTFKISKNAKFYLCGFVFKDARNDNSINLYEVSLEEFKEYTTKSHIPDEIPEPFFRWRIWADVQDGVAIKLYQQFSP